MSIDYQLTAKINASKKLNFNDKAILNEIIAFEKNTNKPFIGTDTYLAEKWGVSLRTIERTISNLKKLEVISSNVVKKKHTEGEKTWYNKRYITVNFEFLTEFVIQPKTVNMTATETQATSDNEAEIIASPPIVKRETILTSDPIDFLVGEFAGTMAEEFEMISELSVEQMDSAILKNNSKNGKASIIDHYRKRKGEMSHAEVKWVYDEIMN